EYEDDLLEIAALIHIDQLPTADRDTFYALADNDMDRINKGRFSIAQDLINTHFEKAKLAGLGVSVPNLKTQNYTITLTETQTKKSKSYRFNPSDWREEPPPSIRVDWGNKQANCFWNTAESKESYYGYNIEYGFKNQGFTKLRERPIVNLNDTSTVDSLHDISFEIPVDHNDSMMVVRMYGYDYFGGMSEQFSEVEGSGSEGIGYGPIFDQIAMVSAKEVALSWTMLEEFDD